MLIRNHEVFELPEAPINLWRYMDFTKLVSLFELHALVFPRTDQFDDPYEGLLPDAAVQELRGGKVPGVLPEHIEQWVRAPQHLRKRLYVSCWCASEHESAAMWNLYLSGSQGVAIRTNTDLLAEALDACNFTVGMSLVKYIDYSTTTIPFGNMLFPVLHK